MSSGVEGTVRCNYCGNELKVVAGRVADPGKADVYAWHNGQVTGRKGVDWDWEWENQETNHRWVLEVLLEVRGGVCSPHGGAWWEPHVWG